MTVANDPNRVYAGRPMMDRRADRRAKFLQAGIEALGSRGYTSSSVADICSAAGLARSQFYNEFANREKLLVAVYDLIQADALAARSSLLSLSGSTVVVGQRCPPRWPLSSILSGVILGGRETATWRWSE